MSNIADNFDEIRSHIERIKNPSSVPLDYTKQPGEWEKNLPAPPLPAPTPAHAYVCPCCDSDGGCTGACCGC